MASLLPAFRILVFRYTLSLPNSCYPRRRCFVCSRVVLDDERLPVGLELDHFLTGDGPILGTLNEHGAKGIDVRRDESVVDYVRGAVLAVIAVYGVSCCAGIRFQRKVRVIKARA